MAFIKQLDAPICILRMGFLRILSLSISTIFLVLDACCVDGFRAYVEWSWNY
jgi:hypothetical protein